MGIFNKTEEEIKRQEEKEKLDRLGERTWNNNNRKVLYSYINLLRDGYPNDFDDIDTLIAVYDKLFASNFINEDDLKNHFKTIISLYHRIVNKNDRNYEMTKSMFIEDFVGEDGCVYKGIFDESTFDMFSDKSDYLEIMHRILRSDIRDELIENIGVIYDYIHKVSKFCLNQDSLKRDVLSLIDVVSDEKFDGDYKAAAAEELDKSRRRIGVYNISPKQLATVDAKLGRIDSYLEEIQTYMNSLQAEKDAVTALIATGREEIKNEKNISINEIKEFINQQRLLLLKQLDDHLLELEDALRTRSDETFREIIETYKQQIEDFRAIFKSYSAEAIKELLDIQKATQDTINRLESYVANEPQLQALLNGAQEQNVLRDKIIKLVDQEEALLAAIPDQTEKKEVTPTPASTDEVVIPGYDRVMVPYRHIVLPETISTKINPFLDDRIPFEKRLKKLEAKMKNGEKNGEIYHKKIKDIAIDIMEGDWPYLWGPSGTGKSYSIKQVAKLLEMDFTKAGKITEPYSILGYNDPMGRYCLTPSFIATLYGQLLFLDEFDNGNPDTQVVLNDIYSELLNKLENPDDVCEVMFGTDIPVAIHPNFRMVAAGNTSGEGENEIYSSRGQIDGSIQERITPIYFDYDDRVEERILADYPNWYKFFISFRKACCEYADNNGLGDPLGSASTRDASALKKYITNNSKTIDQIICEKFVQIKDSEYRDYLARLISDMYDISLDTENPNFNKKLSMADEKVLAKKFVYYCKKGVR